MLYGQLSIFPPIILTVLAKKKFTFLHCKTIVLRNYPYCFCKRCVCTKLKRNANFSTEAESDIPFTFVFMFTFIFAFTNLLGVTIKRAGKWAVFRRDLFSRGLSKNGEVSSGFASKLEYFHHNH